MCLILLSFQQHPIYKLIVAANRDEFYNRKTAPAHSWEDHPEILGGRDLEAGGTWMAMTKQGRISMVTNYRDPHHINPLAPSRGMLVTDYLLNGQSPSHYMESTSKKGKRYNGFNLIVGTPQEMYYYSNYGNEIQKITPGLHGLSNHLLDTPWPKVKRGISNMQSLLNKDDIKPDALLDLLYDDVRAHDDELPDTGVGLEWERMLSPLFIKSAGYGSRCSTVVMIDRSDRVLFQERTYDFTSFNYTTQTFSFKLNQ